MFCAYLEWARDEMLAVSNCDSNDGTNGTRFLGLCMLPAGSAGGVNFLVVRAASPPPPLYCTPLFERHYAYPAIALHLMMHHTALVHELSKM